MNEDVVSIVVDEADKRTVLNTYYEWRRSASGDTIISLPPESAGLLEGDLVNGTRFSSVPRDFLKVLKEKGISYKEF